MSRIEDEQRIVRDLGVMQLGKLRANKHKADWRKSHTDDLVQLLDAEVAELREALKTCKRGHVVMECADVANIVAMIADITSTEGEDES